MRYCNVASRSMPVNRADTSSIVIPPDPRMRRQYVARIAEMFVVTIIAEVRKMLRQYVARVAEMSVVTIIAEVRKMLVVIFLVVILVLTDGARKMLVVIFVLIARANKMLVVILLPRANAADTALTAAGARKSDEADRDNCVVILLVVIFPPRANAVDTALTAAGARKAGARKSKNDEADRDNCTDKSGLSFSTSVSSHTHGRARHQRQMNPRGGHTPGAVLTLATAAHATMTSWALRLLQYPNVEPESSAGASMYAACVDRLPTSLSHTSSRKLCSLPFMEEVVTMVPVAVDEGNELDSVNITARPC